MQGWQRTFSMKPHRCKKRKCRGDGLGGWHIRRGATSGSWVYIIKYCHYKPGFDRVEQVRFLPQGPCGGAVMGLRAAPTPGTHHWRAGHHTYMDPRNLVCCRPAFVRHSSLVRWRPVGLTNFRWTCGCVHKIFATYMSSTKARWHGCAQTAYKQPKISRLWLHLLPQTCMDLYIHIYRQKTLIIRTFYTTHHKNAYNNQARRGYFNPHQATKHMKKIILQPMSYVLHILSQSEEHTSFTKPPPFPLESFLVTCLFRNRLSICLSS